MLPMPSTVQQVIRLQMWLGNLSIDSSDANRYRRRWYLSASKYDRPYRPMDVVIPVNTRWTLAENVSTFPLSYLSNSNPSDQYTHTHTILSLFPPSPSYIYLFTFCWFFFLCSQHSLFPFLFEKNKVSVDRRVWVVFVQGTWVPKEFHNVASICTKISTARVHTNTHTIELSPSVHRQDFAWKNGTSFLPGRRWKIVFFSF